MKRIFNKIKRLLNREGLYHRQYSSSPKKQKSYRGSRSDGKYQSQYGSHNNYKRRSHSS